MDDLGHVLRACGLAAPRAAPPDLGSPRRTHVFVIGEHVVKFDDESRIGAASMVREVQALALLEPTELPVPRVVADGEFPDTRRWVVLTRLPGAAPEDALRPAHELSPSLAAELGEVAARLHACGSPPAFGTWSLPPVRTFLEEHRHRVRILEGMARDAGVVTQLELDALLDLLAATEEPLHGVRQPVLAHRDVQPRNTLVSSSGAMTALLDFESSAGGDPAEDFRVVGLDWRSSAFARFSAAYASAGGALGDRGADRVAHYVLEWTLAIFAYLGNIAPAYLPPAREAVRRIRDGERPDVPC
jgi:aminoglycoside phosphotransferase (APT) family kinase protein